MLNLVLMTTGFYNSTYKAALAAFWLFDVFENVAKKRSIRFELLSFENFLQGSMKYYILVTLRNASLSALQNHNSFPKISQPSNSICQRTFVPQQDALEAKDIAKTIA